MKIGILGLGGVGSFIGAKLANAYADDTDIEVVFICRGETQTIIARDGLTLRSGGREYNVRPHLASDDVAAIGSLDLLIIATKTYSLARIVKQYQPCLSDQSVIMTLQNGVRAKETILRNVPMTNPSILEGCIYVASNIEKPGVVNHVGGPGKVFFGNEDSRNFTWVEDVLRKGGVDATYTKNIKAILWKKYLFVSPVAALTSAYDVTFGELRAEESHMNCMRLMMQEIQTVAKHAGIDLTDQDIENSVRTVESFPPNSKSSLQIDIERDSGETEKPDFVDFIIDKGLELGVATPSYDRVNQLIDARTR